MLDPHTFYVGVVALSADAKIVVTGSWDAAVRVWQIDTGEMVRVLVGPAHLLGGLIPRREVGDPIEKRSHGTSSRARDWSTDFLMKQRLQADGDRPCFLSQTPFDERSSGSGHFRDARRSRFYVVRSTFGVNTP